jgi:hypothetical protein
MDRMLIAFLNISRDMPIFIYIVCTEGSSRTKKKILPIVASTVHVIKKDVMHMKQNMFNKIVLTLVMWNYCSYVN